MNSVNKTLYIPLYGKAYVSSRGILLRDPKAETIWAKEGFPLRGKARSKWLAYYMGMRSAVFDRWVLQAMAEDPEAVILHVGCGMDSRADRVGTGGRLWFDVDFPEVVAERRKYFPETENYHMLPSDIREEAWLDRLPPGSSLIVVMEGVSMYLTPEELTGVLARWTRRFPKVRILMDCYTALAAKATKYKNPINTVGVTQVYGLDDPHALTDGTALAFCREHTMTPEDMICQLDGGERGIFRKLYAGKLAHRLYRLYEYRTKTD